MSIPLYELLALQDLYYATNGPYWNWDAGARNSNFTAHWRFPANPIPNTGPNARSDPILPCFEKWEGISCSCPNTLYNYNVTYQEYEPYYIYWYPYANGDAGSFAHDYFNCTVNEVALVGHNLTGTIPQSISNLRNLTYINFGFNQVSYSFAFNRHMIRLRQLTHY